MGSEDAACNRLTELALNDVSMAGSILAEAVSSSAFAVAAVARPEAHGAFQKVGLCVLSLVPWPKLVENCGARQAVAPPMPGVSYCHKYHSTPTLLCCKAGCLDSRRTNGRYWPSTRLERLPGDMTSLL